MGVLADAQAKLIIFRFQKSQDSRACAGHRRLDPQGDSITAIDQIQGFKIGQRRGGIPASAELDRVIQDSAFPAGRAGRAFDVARRHIARCIGEGCRIHVFVEFQP